MKKSDPHQNLIQAFLQGLQTTLGEKLFGVYLNGAVAFPDTGIMHDIDFHVILAEPLSEREKLDLNNLHAKLSEEFPPLGGELDGYYILLEDAHTTTPPRHQLLPEVVDDSWAIHREHMRAGRCIILHGPDPKEIFPPTTWQELENDLLGEYRYIEDHIHDFPDYSVLNLCRLIYSVHTHDVVVSKLICAIWAQDTFPEWKPLIQTARKSYNAKATAAEKEMLKSKVSDFLIFSQPRILHKLTTQNEN